MPNHCNFIITKGTNKGKPCGIKTCKESNKCSRHKNKESKITTPTSKEKIIFPRISKYTLPIFIERANIIHNYKYDYSQIKEEDIKNQKSKVLIICKKCKDYKFYKTITAHINKKQGCNKCSKRLKWTYDRFIEESKIKNGNKFNYSNIKRSDINKGAYSRIIVFCNKCFWLWETSIHDHLNGGYGCPDCLEMLNTL